MPLYPGCLTYLYFGYMGFGNFKNSTPDQIIKKCPAFWILWVWMPPSRNLSKHENYVRDNFHAQVMGTKAQWPHIFSYVFVKRIPNTMEIRSSEEKPVSYIWNISPSMWDLSHSKNYFSRNPVELLMCFVKGDTLRHLLSKVN